MSVSIISVAHDTFIVDSLHVTVYRDVDGAIVTNPPLETDRQKALKQFIESKYKK